MEKKTQTITIQVTAEDKEMAQKLARLECRSVSGYLRQLLRREIRQQGGGASVSGPRGVHPIGGPEGPPDWSF